MRLIFFPIVADINNSHEPGKSLQLQSKNTCSAKGGEPLIS